MATTEAGPHTDNVTDRQTDKNDREENPSCQPAYADGTSVQ